MAWDIRIGKGDFFSDNKWDGSCSPNRPNKITQTKLNHGKVIGRTNETEHSSLIITLLNALIVCDR